jgi:hypothetical protein
MCIEGPLGCWVCGLSLTTSRWVCARWWAKIVYYSWLWVMGGWVVLRRVFLELHEAKVQTRRRTNHFVLKYPSRSCRSNASPPPPHCSFLRWSTGYFIWRRRNCSPPYRCFLHSWLWMACVANMPYQQLTSCLPSGIFFAILRKDGVL